MLERVGKAVGKRIERARFVVKDCSPEVEHAHGVGIVSSHCPSALALAIHAVKRLTSLEVTAWVSGRRGNHGETTDRLYPYCTGFRHHCGLGNQCCDRRWNRGKRGSAEVNRGLSQHRNDIV